VYKFSSIAAMLMLVGSLMSSVAVAETKTCTLEVSGMTCASCPYMVKGAITEVDGVEDVTVSLQDKKAIVVYDDTKTDVPALIAATENIGFKSILVKD